jgi:nitrate reductase NapE
MRVMSELPAEQLSGTDFRSRRRTEILTFLVLAFGIWPLVAVGVVGGYGFLVWMLQIVFGPPGPPPTLH